MTSSRRVLGLFQTFDSARFDTSNAANLKISTHELRGDAAEDIALARTELLGAILFGHQVVVPAGAVADSPAFAKLLGEVMQGSEQALGKISRINRGERYFPFRVGLEPRFTHDPVKRTGGYDAFVTDYLANFSAGQVNLRELDSLSKKAGSENLDLMKMVANAYLGGNTDDIAKVDPDYAHHIEWVYKLFSNRVLTPAAPVYSSNDQFKEAPGTLYASAIRYCCQKAQAENLDYRGFDEIERVVDEIERALAKDGLARRGGERGTWYRFGGHFGDHWPVVRNWLDRRLNDMFVDGYRIDLPSYFTQKITADPAAVSAAMVYLRTNDRPAIPGIEERIGAIPSKIDWRGIWDMLADRDVQREMAVLQKKLTDRNDHDRAVDGATGNDRLARLTAKDRLAGRRADIGEAIERYVGFINTGQSRVRLDSKTGAVFVSADPKKVPPIMSWIGDLAGSSVVGSATGIGVALLYPPAAAAGFAIGVGVNMAGNISWSGGKALTSRLAGIVRRKPAKPIGPDIASHEHERLSIWTMRNGS